MSAWSHSKVEGRDQKHQHLQCSRSRGSRVRLLPQGYNLAVAADDEARFELLYSAVDI